MEKFNKELAKDFNWITFLDVAKEVIECSCKIELLAERETIAWLKDIEDPAVQPPNVVDLITKFNWLPSFVKAFHENDPRVIEAINKIKAYHHK